MQLSQRRKSAIVMFLIVILAGIFVFVPVNARAQSGKTTPAVKQLPRLVDVGATQCIPCKMMAPVLDELEQEYTGILNVEFIDVWENPKAGEKYRVRGIPTQIFYGATGKELGRHLGYISKEDILAKFKALGILLVKTM